MATFTVAQSSDDAYELANGTTDTTYQYYLIADAFEIELSMRDLSRQQPAKGSD